MIYFVKTHKEAIAPTQAYKNDSGFDFYAMTDVTIRPGEVVTVSTGLRLLFPNKLAAWGWDKSGRGARGIKTLGGVMDNGYTDAVQIILANVNLWPIVAELANNGDAKSFRVAIAEATVTIPYGKAIAQLCFDEPVQEKFQEIDHNRFDILAHERRMFSRGDKGFSSSDEKATLKELLDPPVKA